MLQTRNPFCPRTSVVVALETTQVWGTDPAHAEIQRGIGIASKMGVGLDRPEIGGRTDDPDGWRLVEDTDGELFERALVFDAYLTPDDLLTGGESIGQIVLFQYLGASGQVSDCVSWTGTTSAVEHVVRGIRANSTTPEA